MSNVDDALYYRREFLNEEGKHSLAAVLAEVKPGDADPEYLDMGATFQIGDCSRSVTLDFGVFGTAKTAKDRKGLREDIENSRIKAERLLATLREFVDTLDDALEKVEADLEAREDADREAKKAKKAKKKRKKAQRKAVALAELQEA